MTADPRDPQFPETEGNIPSDENATWEDETPPAGDVDADALPEGEEITEETAPTEEEDEELYASPEDEGTYAAEEPPRRKYLFPVAVGVGLLVVGFVVYNQAKPFLIRSSAPQPLPALPITATPSPGTQPAVPPLGSNGGQIPAFPKPEEEGMPPSSLPLPTTEEEAAKANRPFISGPSEPQPLEAGQSNPVVPPETPVTTPEATTTPSTPSVPLASLPPKTETSEGSPLLQSETEEMTSPSVSTSLPPSSVPTSSKMEDRIGQLEQSVAALTAQQATLAQMKDTITQLENQVEDLKISVASKSKVKTTAEKTAPAKAPTAPAPKTKEQTPPPESPAGAATVSRWIVLSATPSQAWVKLEGKNIQRRVVIGDTLVGIGQITSIRKEETGWVIEGTQGKIQ